MSSLDILKREYPGDVAWWNFVDVFRVDWKNRSDKDVYLSVIRDEEIAIVLSAKLGVDALGWFKHTIGALDGKSPADVLNNQMYGNSILRSLIMRMPS